MNDIELKNKIEAARLEGWSEGYNEGMKAACNYVIHCIDMKDINTIIADLKIAVKLCGGDDMNENVLKVEALKTHEFMVVLDDLITDRYEVLTFTVEAYDPMDAYTLALHRAWNIIKTTEGYENKIIRQITMYIDNYKKGE